MLSYVALAIAFFLFACLCMFNTYRLFIFTKKHNTLHEENISDKLKKNKVLTKKNQTNTNINAANIQTIFEDIKGYDSKLNNFEEILTTATKNITGNSKMDNQFQTNIDTLNNWKDDTNLKLEQNVIKINEIDNEVDSYNKRYTTVSNETIEQISSIENEMDDLNEKLEKLQNDLIAIDYVGS